jgi:hypothetical protein
MPWRLVISLNSFTLCEQWVVKGRLFATAAQQVFGAGVDLRGRYDAVQPSAGIGPCRIDQFERGVETAAAGRFVPGILQLPIVAQVPAGGGVAGGNENPQSRLRREIDPALVDAGKIRDRRDAGEQHLAVGGGLAGLAALGVRAEGEAPLIQAGHEHGGQAMFLTNAAEERFGARVGMDVHQTGHDHQVVAGDLGVDGARIEAADVADAITLEDEVGIAEIRMAGGSRVPGDDPGCVSDAGYGHFGVLIILLRRSDPGSTPGFDIPTRS